MADSKGDPTELNHSNAVADSGNERTVGAHFGIYALPVPGFINEVAASQTTRLRLSLGPQRVRLLRRWIMGRPRILGHPLRWT